MVNPSTGQRMLVPPKPVLNFKPNSNWKERKEWKNRVMKKVSVNEIATKLIERKGLSKKQARAYVMICLISFRKGLEKR